LGEDSCGNFLGVGHDGFFDPEKVAIVSNGQCGSSCSLFSVSFLCFSTVEQCY
jgi:hypothetical protein